jgi:hypothetical protein
MQLNIFGQVSEHWIVFVSMRLVEQGV